MKFLKLSILCGILFFTLNMNGQKFANVSEIEGGPNNAALLGIITIEGVSVPIGTEIAAFDPASGNIVGHGFIMDAGGGSTFFNFNINGSNGSRTQMIPGNCFKLSVFYLSDSDSIDVEVVPSDPRLCGPPSSILPGGSLTTLNIKQNGYRSLMPSFFGPYSATNGQPLNMNWDGFGSEGALNLLPVTYSSISLSNQDCKQVSFNWTTSSEINNEGFYVERKVEGARTWESLDFIEGNGTSYEEIDYRFVDTEITTDKSLKVVYYRLKQIDYDGRIEYSDTKSVRLNCGKSTFINVFPNPAYDQVNLEVNHEGLDDEAVTIEIYSMNGQLVSRTTQKLTNKETIQLQTGDFSPGIYSIQAFTNNLIISHTRFTKN